MIALLRRLIPERHPLRLAFYRFKAFAAALWYRFPSRRLTVIGITGTDGKTTTVGMVAHILRHIQKSACAASTAFLQINEERRENATHLTSLSPFLLQAFLRKAVRAGCTHAVIEMSSHGLVQSRVSYTWPLVGGITNTALEHLDYHKTMEQYRRDKGNLFQMLRKAGVKVLNGSDESFPMYAAIPSASTITYGNDHCDLWLTHMRASAQKCEAQVHTHDGQTADLTLSIPGMFNLDNALCAIACVMALHIPMEVATHALETFAAIPGRMERIDAGQPFSVYVDFAVSPQAYEKILTTLRHIVGKSGRVMVMCSSCGNRMREKRPEVGRLCSTLADVVVVTEDETYGEDPHDALEDVWDGINHAHTAAHKIFDRREAIRFLIRHAKPGDAIAFCGMGPFSTMTKLEGRIPWDERKIVREELEALAALHPFPSTGAATHAA